ncbi:GNAT family N-acetyltransferase [Leifsonia soli]|uniref:RimJ/RimL family protein N-acetyltransferase n=1 Tax=Leifsonia soli TaxID=582665 RepID=A0A852T499_9MICO|nr:GNAT family N-acetyltransferase [Leifsonia soli]NYD75643.1 RimJ/RimL family protein N-acetyltransferase [Leifsonia soli]
MAHLEGVTWPPAHITTDRLVLRAAEARDREAMLDLFSDPRVNRFVGGAEPREHLDELMPELPGQRTGFFVIEHDRRMIGIVTFDPRDPERSGPVSAEGGEAELGYMLLPDAWGRGYGTEACAAAISWFLQVAPDLPLVVSTQLANTSSLRLIEKLGFVEVERTEDWGHPQWYGMWPRSNAQRLETTRPAGQ